MPSKGLVGDAYDNAMAESFFATLERELLSRRRFRSQAEAKILQLPTSFRSKGVAALDVCESSPSTPHHFVPGWRVPGPSEITS